MKAEIDQQADQQSGIDQQADQQSRIDQQYQVYSDKSKDNVNIHAILQNIKRNVTVYKSYWEGKRIAESQSFNQDNNMIQYAQSQTLIAETIQKFFGAIKGSFKDLHGESSEPSNDKAGDLEKILSTHIYNNIDATQTKSGKDLKGGLKDLLDQLKQP